MNKDLEAKLRELGFGERGETAPRTVFRDCKGGKKSKKISKKSFKQYIGTLDGAKLYMKGGAVDDWSGSDEEIDFDDIIRSSLDPKDMDGDIYVLNKDMKGMKLHKIKNGERKVTVSLLPHTQLPEDRLPHTPLTVPENRPGCGITPVVSPQSNEVKQPSFTERREKIFARARAEPSKPVIEEVKEEVKEEVVPEVEVQVLKKPKLLVKKSGKKRVVSDRQKAWTNFVNEIGKLPEMKGKSRAFVMKEAGVRWKVA